MIKDILVHLDGTPDDAVRLSYGAHLARHFEALLIGLNVHFLPESMAVTDPVGGQYLAGALQEDDTAAKMLDRRLGAELADLGVPSELRRIDVLQANLKTQVGRSARVTDLFVALRPYGTGGGAAETGEAALFTSGRATLFVPPGGTPPAAYGRIAVAWKDTTEAARVVAEAMPFLREAVAVTVIVAEEVGGDPAAPGPAALLAHLGRHGIDATAQTVPARQGVADALLAEARRLNADMLVMGGFGHARLWEWVVGGATREVLSRAEVPVLMAH